MELQQPLTKENFWNEMMEKYPRATKLFCEWIDEYKKAVDWNKLFSDHFSQSNVKRAGNGEIYSIDFNTPKFHDIPHAMQQGIFIEFIRQNLGNYFEQVERHMSEFYDFEEDVKNVLCAIEDTL